MDGFFQFFFNLKKNKTKQKKKKQSTTQTTGTAEAVVYPPKISSGGVGFICNWNDFHK